MDDEWLTFDVESLADLSKKERERERIDPIETRFYFDYRTADNTREMAGCVFAPAYVSIRFS